MIYLLIVATMLLREEKAYLFIVHRRVCEAADVVKCPRCKKESQPTGKEWDYRVFKVKVFICPNDGKSFNAYYKDGKLTHTIPKNKQ